jgi:hypothetical protein
VSTVALPLETCAVSLLPGFVVVPDQLPFPPALPVPLPPLPAHTGLSARKAQLNAMTAQTAAEKCLGNFGGIIVRPQGGCSIQGCKQWAKEPTRRHQKK